MIILYEYTETAFTNNGLGCLNDATSCVVKETLNSEYELEMEYPVNGIHYSDIQLRRIIFAKPNSYDQAQPFRIYSISKPIGGIVTVNAEHISYDMSGLPVRGALENYAWYVNDVFEHIRNNSVYPCPFTFSSDITEEKKSINLSKPRSVKAFLGTDDGLLSLFGGEWEFDRYNAILHKKRGQNRGVSIEYGKNLTDVTQDEACSEMYTAVYPYYYQEDDGLQKLDDDVIKILDTEYKNVYVLDLSSEFDEMPTQDQLREKAQEYINDNKLGEPKVSLKVSFIKNPEVIEALHDVRLGDTVSVKFIKIGVDTTSRCISYEFNVLTEQYNSIELGEPIKTIVDTMTSTNSAIIDTQNNLDAEIDRATGVEGTLNTRIEKTSEGLEMEVSQRQANDLDLSTRISQTPHAIDLIASGGDNSVGIEIQLYDENGNLIGKESETANITIIGFVAFEDLETTGRTTINGSNIKTGTISADRIDTENLVAKNGNFTKSFHVDLNENGLEKTLSFDNDRFEVNIQNQSMSSRDSSIVIDPNGSGNKYIEMTASNGFGDIVFNCGDLKKGNTVLATVDDILTTEDLDKRYMYDKVSGGSDGTGSVFVHSITYSSGILTVTTASVKSSDERLKTNVSDMPDLESVYMKFNPKKFRFDDRLKGYDHRWHYGLLAQSVEESLIEAGISIDDTGLIWKEPVYDDFHEREVICDEMVYKLDKDELHAMHIQMIQKQHKEIEQLKLENVQIKGELDILKQKLERMEERYANHI